MMYKFAQIMFIGTFVSLVVLLLSAIFSVGICLYKSNGCTGVPVAFQDTPISREYFE